MRKRNFILKYATVFILTSAVLTSCNDPDPLPLDAITDVLAQKIVEEGEEKYALAFWVMGNKEIESVIVESPAEETWDLESSNDNNTIFSFFPETHDYITSMPEAGTYTFTVSSTQADEEALILTDELEEEELDAVVINNVEFIDEELNITWEDVNGNDVYFVRLFNDTEQLIYNQEVDEDETEFIFGLNDQGWLDPNTKAQDGKSYRLELLAVLYESGVTTEKDYNIQFISIASTEIVWGE